MSEPEIETPDTEPDVELPADDDLEEEEEDNQTPAEAAAADGSAEIAKKLKAATTGYHTRIYNILGAEMEKNLCPMCDGFGFADEQQKSRVEGLPADFVHPDNYVTCQACNGYGEILSGSKNPQHAVVVCTACSGLGYTIQTAQVYAVPPPAVPVAPPAQQMNGVYVPGRGFIPYGETDPIPGTAG